MGKHYKIALIIYIGFILSLVCIIIGVVLKFLEYDSNPDAMGMVDFQGILLSFLGAAVLCLISVVLTFSLARAWAKEQPENTKDIFRLALITNIILIVIIGGLEAGIIILRTLWTIGYF